MENGKVLVSHPYNCHKLNKTLYLTFADKLYLINEFGSNDDKVIRKLKSENKFLSTETPLYHPHREMIYQCAKVSPLTDNDIKHLYTIMPNALQQSKRLKLNLNGYDISPDMVKMSLVNMYLHKFTNPKINEYDTLSSEDRWNEYYDVILAKRTKKIKENFIRKNIANFGYYLISNLSETHIPKNVGEFRMISKKVVKEIIKMDDIEFFLRGIVSYVGFSQKIIEFEIY